MTKKEKLNFLNEALSRANTYCNTAFKKEQFLLLGPKKAPPPDVQDHYNSRNWFVNNYEILTELCLWPHGKIYLRGYNTEKQQEINEKGFARPLEVFLRPEGVFWSNIKVVEKFRENIRREIQGGIVNIKVKESKAVHRARIKQIIKILREDFSRDEQAERANFKNWSGMFKFCKRNNILISHRSSGRRPNH